MTLLEVVYVTLQDKSIGFIVMKSEVLRKLTKVFYNNISVNE